MDAWKYSARRYSAYAISLLVYVAILRQCMLSLHGSLTGADGDCFCCSNLSSVLGCDELGDLSNGDSLTLVSVMLSVMSFVSGGSQSLTSA